MNNIGLEKIKESFKYIGPYKLSVKIKTNISSHTVINHLRFKVILDLKIVYMVPLT